MSDYIKREDAVFIVLQQPMLSTSVVTEIRLLDGIDIVRCEECKHWLNDHICTHWSGYYGTIETIADDFCSYGEREGE